VLELNDITKLYGKTRAVSHLNLKLEPGQLFGFIGPNGAGKTTTIKLIVGLLQATEGLITFEGLDIQKEPEKVKAKIGYIPDTPYLYDSLTGREFLRFVGSLFRVEEKSMNHKMGEIIERLEMKDWIDYRISEYSHGMRQKTTFASALLHEPRLLLVDEPMVGLDPKSARIVKEIFREMTGEGKTVFISTHTLSLAEEICSLVGMMNSGKLTALGEVGELKSKAGLRDGTLEEAYLKLTL
jgi:ABC-2 type transport system ATP-binding protein